MAQRSALRVGHHGVPGDVHRDRSLSPDRPAALHDHRLLRQETTRAQDREQQTAQTQVSLRPAGGARERGGGMV